MLLLTLQRVHSTCWLTCCPAPLVTTSGARTQRSFQHIRAHTVDTQQGSEGPRLPSSASPQRGLLLRREADHQMAVSMQCGERHSFSHSKSTLSVFLCQLCSQQASGPRAGWEGREQARQGLGAQEAHPESADRQEGRKQTNLLWWHVLGNRNRRTDRGPQGRPLQGGEIEKVWGKNIPDMVQSSVRGFSGNKLVGSETSTGRRPRQRLWSASQVTARGSGLCEGGRTWTG